MKRTIISFMVAAIVGANAYAASGDETVVTSKKYVDDEMAKLQPEFSALGNNKLMVYSDTTAGAVTSRDIVTTLGDSTTADSIPTRGAINTALATKQNTLNGTAGWVVENTGTAGSVKAKPVYSTTDNYKTALVEADDLNTIITNAVNSELTEVAEGWQINTVGNLTLPTLRLYIGGLDSSINGTSMCYRRLNGTTNDDNGKCSAATLATLGAIGNKSGLWGTVMPYGDIVGKSVCSSQSGTNNIVATAEQNTALDTEFITQTGNGNLANAQKYCWCKMESISGEPAVSRWGFLYGSNYPRGSACANGCANACAGRVRDALAFRSPMFNSLQ